MNERSRDNASRAKARELVKKIHPFIRPDQHVHHIDGNPLNNDIRNLCILPKSFHMSLHHLGAKRPNMKKKPIDLRRTLRHVERELFFYNNRIY